MVKYYKRFCCGIFYLLKEKAKSDIPLFASFMFTVFLFVLILYGIESLFYLLLKYNFKIDKYLAYCICIIFGFLNYFFVFQDKELLKFYHVRTTTIRTVILVSVIFISNLAFVLLGGVRLG